MPKTFRSTISLIFYFGIFWAVLPSESFMASCYGNPIVSSQQGRCFMAQISHQPMYQHIYPCRLWLTEHSCAECRQIADEQSYLHDAWIARNDRRSRLGLPTIPFDEFLQRGN